MEFVSKNATNSILISPMKKGGAKDVDFQETLNFLLYLSQVNLFPWIYLIATKFENVYPITERFQEFQSKKPDLKNDDRDHRTCERNADGLEDDELTAPATDRCIFVDEGCKMIQRLPNLSELKSKIEQFHFAELDDFYSPHVTFLTDQLCSEMNSKTASNIFSRKKGGSKSNRSTTECLCWWYS